MGEQDADSKKIQKSLHPSVHCTGAVIKHFNMIFDKETDNLQLVSYCLFQIVQEKVQSKAPNDWARSSNLAKGKPARPFNKEMSPKNSTQQQQFSPKLFNLD